MFALAAAHHLQKVAWSLPALPQNGAAGSPAGGTHPRPFQLSAVPAQPPSVGKRDLSLTSASSACARTETKPLLPQKASRLHGLDL